MGNEGKHRRRYEEGKFVTGGVENCGTREAGKTEGRGIDRQKPRGRRDVRIEGLAQIIEVRGSEELRFLMNKTPQKSYFFCVPKSEEASSLVPGEGNDRARRAWRA
ncbi:MAG: hypothetical protein AAFY15_16270 [Cyanobacteria bacterium J06648_11]